MSRNLKEAFRWLKPAEKDLASAQNSFDAGDYERACFQSQQSAGNKICRIDIGRGEETYKEIGYKLKELAKVLREKYNVSKIIVFGSYVRGDLNEGSDIDLMMVGDFKGKFHKRIADVIGLTDLPIEPLCYTEEEFREMIVNKNFLSEILKEGVLI